MGFEWVTLDGCAVCMALEVYTDHEPPRPHPNCDCEIFADSDELDPGWCWGEFDGEPMVLTHPLRIVRFVTVTKVCPDGQEVHDNFEIEQSLDEYIEMLDDAEAWEDAHDEMHDHIDGMCANELEWKCSEFVVPDP